MSVRVSVTVAAPALLACGMLALSAARRLLRPPGDLLPPPGLAGMWAAGARGCSGASAGSPNPVVYLDVGADNQPLGRVVLEVGARRLRAACPARGPGDGAAEPRAAWPRAWRRGSGQGQGGRAAVAPGPAARAHTPLCGRAGVRPLQRGRAALGAGLERALVSLSPGSAHLCRRPVPKAIPRAGWGQGRALVW